MIRPFSRPILRAAGMASAAALALLLASPVPARSAVSRVAPAASSPVHYVALGDSYSAGVGAGNYISSSGSCERSHNSYPALWAAAHSPTSFVSKACLGATTSDVISGQLSALSSRTSLVSVTVGGNDVGFTSVMVTCDLDFLSTADCVKKIDSAEAKAKATLPAALNRLLSRVKADAPQATVILLGYPLFYDLTKSSSCIGLSTTDRTDIDKGINMLDGLIKNAAARHGDVFADVRKAFAGHEICDSSSWMNSIDLLHIRGSYHPTATGQADGYLPVFTAAAAAATG